VHDSRRTRLILAVLLAAALALITVDSRGGTNGSGGPIGGLRGIGGAIFGSAESLVGSVARPVAGLFDNVTGAPAAQRKVTALQREVIRLRTELSLAQLNKAQEAQLRRLLALAGRGGYRIVAANVIAAGPGYNGSVTIDAGRDDGIKPNETVLNGSGLVGTVTSVTARTSTVLLTTDASSTVGVRLAGTGQIGAVTGTGRSRPGPALLRLQVFDANAVLQPGQQLVTFGSVHGRPYVPGVPVGVITQVQASAASLTKLAFVRPYVDEGALGVVGVVIVPPRTNPRDSVLPPRPAAPGPTPRPARSGGHASQAPSPGATAGGGA
jgi:rod shape-determining protein MreC